MPEPSGGALTLDQWLALNDEIAAMVRAGLPLERSLAGFGRRRLGKVSRSIAARLERGEGLERAVAEEGAAAPPIYQAVIRAGIRSGRLPAALEGLASYGRHYAEMRRMVGLALIYPLLVVVLAYGLLIGFLLYVLPPFLETFATFRLPARRFLGLLEGLGRTLPYWAPVLPIVLIALVLAWCVSGRARSFPGSGGRLWALIPGARGLMAQVAAASFAELLAILIEHDVPLPEALDLAAHAAGDPALRRAGPRAAEALRGGTAAPGALREAREMPALLRWVLSWGVRQGRLAPALRHAAEMYRRRARLRADLLRTLLPTLALLAVGATAAVLYTLVLFVPFASLLRSIAETL